MNNELNGTRPVYRLEDGRYQCQRCGHIWLARKLDVEPISCPAKVCHSPYYRVARTRVNRKKEQIETPSSDAAGSSSAVVSES